MARDFEQAFQFVLGREGGYVNDEYDPGGETKFGISKRSYPHLDIKNLTVEDAKEIYRRDYWKETGCDLLAWPLSLNVFDCAVNAGPEAALFLLQQTKDPEEYLARRLDAYTSFRQWERYGRGWTRRLASLLRETSGEAATFTIDTLVLHSSHLEEPVVIRGRAVARVTDTYSGTKQDVRFADEKLMKGDSDGA